MKVVQAVAIVGGSYLISLLIAFGMIVLTAGLTEHWGAARAGTAMVTMLAGIAVLFLCGAVVDFILLRSSVPRVGWRIGIVLGYAAILVPTLAGLAFLAAVLFDR